MQEPCRPRRGQVPRPRARERDKRFGKETWRRDHLDVAAELLDQTYRICVPAAAITWSES